jgi:hypothetical protein
MPAQKCIALGAHSSSEFPLNSHLFHLKKAEKAEKAAHAMHWKAAEMSKISEIQAGDQPGVPGEGKVVREGK